MSEDQIVQKVVKYLENSLALDLKSTVRKMLQEVVHEEFEAIHKSHERIEKIFVTNFQRQEKTLDMWKSDQDEDRDNLRNIRTNTASTKTELEEVGKTVSSLPKKVENAAKDAVNEAIPSAVAEEIPKAVNDTFDIFGKRIKIIEKPKRGWLGWLKFWK